MGTINVKLKEGFGARFWDLISSFSWALWANHVLFKVEIIKMSISFDHSLFSSGWLYGDHNKEVNSSFSPKRLLSFGVIRGRLVLFPMNNEVPKGDLNSMS